MYFFMSCKNSSDKKSVEEKDNVSKPATSVTDQAVADSGNGQAGNTEAPAPFVVDTVASINDAAGPGRYIFRAPTGNYYSFDVAGAVTHEDYDKEYIMTDAGMVENPPCNHDYFDAVDRPGAKTTPARAEIEMNSNPRTVFSSLMRNEAGLAQRFEFPENGRGPGENRNVHFERLYMYTFTREGDEDYHLIVGTTPTPRTAFIFNIEISGLPRRADNYGYRQLAKARKDFEDFLGINGTCKVGYRNND